MVRNGPKRPAGGNRIALRGVEPPMRRTSAVLLTASLLLALAACGDDGEPVSSGGDPAGDAATVVLSISTGGGFAPVGTDFASVPTLVMGDGTVFTGGPTTMQFPGPALSPVLTGTLASGELDRLLEAAATAGLDEDGVDYGQPGITDVGSTTITVELDGTTHTTDVYALGYEDGTGGLTAAQREARAKVQAFVSAASDRVAAAATTALDPTAYQVQASPSEPASSFTEEPRPNEVAWPFADVPLTTDGCIDLGGADATTFAAALDGASSNTIWTDAAGGSWHLAIRATLPDEPTCG
jgi:hypothetical protein